ncbi:MAG: hypothetical protein JXA14_22925 [Anaerolineae bacterium]|nr:hypothetical protein [Anaerolineae bacterium]
MPATSITKWRSKNKPEEVTLPSGNVALLRRVHILELARGGAIPTVLATMMSGDGKVSTNPADMLKNADDLTEMLDMIDAVVMRAFVQPKLGKEATDEQLAIGEVNVTDRMFVFRWCNGEAEQLGPFRPKPEAGVESTPAGEDLRDEAV